jgi:hypothetical protein
MHLHVLLVPKLEKNTKNTKLMGYGLDVLGLESRQGQQIYIYIFFPEHLTRSGAHPPSPLPGVMRPGLETGHSRNPLSTLRISRAVSPLPLNVSVAFIGATLPLKFIHVIKMIQTIRIRNGNKNCTAILAFRFSSLGCSTEWEE